MPAQAGIHWGGAVLSGDGLLDRRLRWGDEEWRAVGGAVPLSPEVGNRVGHAAEAGIHSSTTEVSFTARPRESGDPEREAPESFPSSSWVPAYAGTSGLGVPASLSCPHLLRASMNTDTAL